MKGKNLRKYSPFILSAGMCVCLFCILSYYNMQIISAVPLSVFVTCLFVMCCLPRDDKKTLRLVFSLLFVMGFVSVHYLAMVGAYVSEYGLEHRRVLTVDCFDMDGKSGDRTPPQERLEHFTYFSYTPFNTRNTLGKFFIIWLYFLIVAFIYCAIYKRHLL